MDIGTSYVSLLFVFAYASILAGLGYVQQFFVEMCTPPIAGYICAQPGEYLYSNYPTQPGSFVV